MALSIITGIVNGIKNTFGGNSQTQQTNNQAAAATIQSQPKSQSNTNSSPSQNTRPTPGRGNYGSNKNNDDREKSAGAQALTQEIDKKPASSSDSNSNWRNSVAGVDISLGKGTTGNILQEVANQNKPEKTVTEALRENPTVSNTKTQTDSNLSKWQNPNVDWDSNEKLPADTNIEDPTAAVNDGGIFNNPIDLIGTLAGVGVGAKVASTVAPKIIAKVPDIAKSAAKSGATVASYGTLVGVGGETQISPTTSKITETLKDTSKALQNNANSDLERIGANIAGFTLGTVGGAIDTLGTIPSAGKGVVDIFKEIKNNGIGAGFEKIIGGFETSATGLKEWIKEIPNDPAYSAGEILGFGKTYQTVSGIPGKVTTKLGKETGLIDTRLVDAGETIVSKNPLLSSAVASGAVESGGFLRVDSAPKAVLTGFDLKVLDNTGSRIEVKTPGGKELFVAGRSNPLSPSGELDLARSQKEFAEIAKQEGVPFIYGTEQFGKAGTFLGMLDRSPNYASSKLAREAANALFPIDVTVRTGRVLSYDLNNPVNVGGIKTQSSKLYSAGEMEKAYSALTGNQEKLITLKEFENSKGLTPTLTPKQASGQFRDIAESEHAWGTSDGLNPRFTAKSFGGFTTTGLPITKLGSSQNIFSTLVENRRANKDILRNPFVRSNNELIDLRKGQSDVIDYFARDASFRLAELIGKPAGINDITEHGSKHVENVAKLARELKYQNPKKYGSVSDREIYFAGILHDVSKNTARDSVPGGHGEMAGSIILRGSSLDARKYLKPEAVPEFENILGKAGTERYNTFLDEFGKLTPKEKLRIAAAISHHTTNLKGIKGQAHRITENKLGQLLSDADRIELGRFSSNPETFKPKQRLMFSTEKAQRNAASVVYGDSPKIAKSERLFDNRNSPIIAKGERLFDNRNFKQPKPERYPYGKGRTNPIKAYAPAPKGLSVGAIVDFEPSKPVPYDFTESKSDYGFTESKSNYGFSTQPNNDKGYEGSPNNYSFKGAGKNYSSIGKALALADLEFTPKKKKDEKKELDFGTFRTIKMQRIDHLGIYDPLEFLGKGSMTSRSRSELTNFKRTFYEVDGAYQTRKPKGRSRR